MRGGYDSIYLGLLARLPECDLREAADRLDLDYFDGGVRLRFLGREYRINRDGVQPQDGQSADVNIFSVLLYYVLSTGQGDPEGSYVLFEAIPRMLGAHGSRIRLMSTPLERHFANSYGAFSEAAIKLGGVEEMTRCGTHQWGFVLLPKIPLKLAFHEADDEFPVSIQIMLDSTAIQYLEFERLAFAVGCFVRALIKTAQHGDVVGWE